ncbi:protein CURVATURE THYLAKOID 1A, chloroplastic-like isoform X1 [Musa acuminata AAA Group]|uniref:protein CURVATURE THYLAKOID 1A, chloroplastic-like isoform X1 n=1 Tax=Musa acuminata AAA Group TaxID=214697 RepID=UPI0031DA7D04
MAATAFAAASPPAAVLSGSRLPAPAPGSASHRAPVLLLPPPPRRSFSSPPISLSSSQPRADHCRFSSLRARATSSSEESSGSGDELLADLKEKWDSIENKSTVLLYGGGAIVAVWLSSVVVGAINSVPLLPKIMELVGLGYTGWFVYRYLLFKDSRKELVNDIEALKKKIAGTGE